MKSLVTLAFRNPRAVTVMMLAVVVVGGLCLTQIPVDILPVFNRPAVQVITFYSGMPPSSIASGITNRMERWTGTADGMRRQESRSILGVSIIRNYFRSGVDPNGALTEVNSLALAEIPNLPPGTLPPIVLPYDPTTTVPACIVALESNDADRGDPVRRRPLRSAKHDHELARRRCAGGVRRQTASHLGLSRPDQVAGPRAVAARRVASHRKYNLFLPTGDAKFGSIDFAIDSNAMFDKVEQMDDIPLRRRRGNAGLSRRRGRRPRTRT